MVNKMRSFVALALLMLVTTLCAQVTTSGIDGVVTADKEPVIGATVLAIHEPSGTRYGTITNVDGRFALQGMRAGGPYKIEISYIGYRTETYSGVQLQLGETFRLNVALKESTQMMDELVVIGEKAGLESSRTGAATSFNLGAIQSIPMISRSVTDITRLTPQASVNSNGAVSFAGANNRYNSFQIDGAMNNDVFGLTANGMNGGQASTQPVSMETIEQIQVNIAPFDVRQSGFTGGGVNAITKSGTNKFHGSAYFYGNNQNLIGTTAGKMENEKKRSKYQDQNDYQYGLTLGGPILKNKLFFFANYEKTDKSYPTSNNINDGSKLTQASADAILAHMKELTGGKYNANFDGRDIITESDKVGFKIDWNINDRHKLTARYSFVKASDDVFGRSATSIRTSDNGYAFSNRTTSYILELNSRVGDKNPINNELRFSYVSVRDKRAPFGEPFPNFSITGVDGSVTVNLGTEYSSCANALDQDILTLTDNLTWLVGKHNLTFGTHNELYEFENLFIQNLYGSYSFQGLDNFLQGNVSQYYYGQAKENITGTPNWAPNFGAAQLGLYVQDQWEITNNFSLTYGLRMDVPMFMDTPTENKAFNEWEVAKQWDVKTNRDISSSPLFSPRAGFRWSIDREKGMLLRGGVGVFTGRIPFVWLSNSFSNTGVEFMKYSYSFNKDNPYFPGFNIVTDPHGQLNMLQNATTSNTTEVDVFSKDFKFSQNLRANLAFEYRLPFDVKMTLEGMYSKTLNDVLYRNLNIEETGETFGSKYSDIAAFDNRPYYKKINYDDYTYVMLLDNTSKGYTYNLSAKLEKSFDFGLDAMVAYTYGQSKSLNSGGSSVAWSNFRYNYTVGPSNNPELGYSNFNIPHRIVGMVTYNKKWNNNLRTSVSLIYTGQSGSPYNVYYDGDLNGDGSYNNDLLFIPTDAQIDQMKFVSNKNVTIEQQKADYKAWLGSAAYLKDHRGEYYKRNADNAPWENHFDFRFMQEFSLKVGKEYHSLQLSFDILNVGNLLNREWGLEGNVSYYAPVAYGNLANANGDKEYGFQFLNGSNYKPLTNNDFYSRWRAQIGVRYSF